MSLIVPGSGPPVTVVVDCIVTRPLVALPRGSVARRPGIATGARQTGRQTADRVERLVQVIDLVAAGNGRAKPGRRTESGTLNRWRRVRERERGRTQSSTCTGSVLPPSIVCRKSRVNSGETGPGSVVGVRIPNVTGTSQEYLRRRHFRRRCRLRFVEHWVEPGSLGEHVIVNINELETTRRMLSAPGAVRGSRHGEEPRSLCPQRRQR